MVPFERSHLDIFNDSTLVDHTVLVTEIFAFKVSEMSGLNNGGIR